MTKAEHAAALRALIEEWEGARGSQLEQALLPASLAHLRTPDAVGAAGQVPDVPLLWEFLAGRGVQMPGATRFCVTPEPRAP
jgi:hypothetical protein